MDARQPPAPQARLEGHRAAVLRHAVRRALHLGRDCGDPAQSVRTDLRRMIRPVFTELALFLAPFVVYAHLSGGDQGGAADAGVLAAQGARHARHLRAGPDDRQLHLSRRISPARRRARPTSRRMSRTASSCPGGRCGERAARSLKDAAGCAKARWRGCSQCSTATARRRAWSAARCATRCSASRSATSTSPPPRCRRR